MNTLDKKRLIFVGFVSNVFEWYDFVIYAYLANIIGILFFNEQNPDLALIKSFMIFSISYLIRPLGSLVFGYISDHYGRSVALKKSLLVMAASTFLIGLLPVYSSAGYISVIMLSILRLLQGFSAGGELPVNTCYMYEISPLDKKNFYCSLVAASSMAGVFMGSLTITFLYLFLSEDQMLAWGWRIPFLAGIIIAFFIFKMRRMISETSAYLSIQPRSFSGYINDLWECKYQIKQVFLLNSFISVVFYLLFVWMPSYLVVFLAIKPSIAHLTNSISLFMLIFFTLVTGYISRNNNRKKWIRYSVFLILIFSYPLFALLKLKLLAVLLIVQIAFAVFLSLIDGVINATMGSLFQPQTRGGGISIGFTFSTAIFGGLTPTLSSYLIYQTGNVESPIFIITTIAILILPAVKYLNAYQEGFSA